MATHNISGLASSLATRGLLPFDKLQQITTSAANEKKSLVSYLVENNFISSIELAQFCEAEYGIPLLDSDTLELDDIPDKYINEKLIEKHHVLPVYQAKEPSAGQLQPMRIVCLYTLAHRNPEEVWLYHLLKTLLQDVHRGTFHVARPSAPPTSAGVMPA